MSTRNSRVTKVGTVVAAAVLGGVGSVAVLGGTAEAVPGAQERCSFGAKSIATVDGWKSMGLGVTIDNGKVARKVIAHLAADLGVDTLAEVRVGYSIDGGPVKEKVYGPGKKCNTSKVIKGASGRSASYSPDYTSGDPSAYVIDGEHPMLSVTAMEFPSTKAAITYLHGYTTSTKDCPGDTPGGGGSGGGQPDCTAKMKKLKFALGDERWGYQMRSTCRISGQTTSSVFNTLFVRQGKYVVYASAMSMDASAPSIPKSIDLTALALKSV